jgi:hypothetical protein
VVPAREGDTAEEVAEEAAVEGPEGGDFEVVALAAAGVATEEEEVAEVRWPRGGCVLG